jgi:O-antigen/teichoic acid export membrane protein
MTTQTKKITLDAAALFAGKAVGLLLGVVRLNYFASYLGLEQFGLLNFAAYFVLLFQSLFDLGIAQLLTREIARETSRSETLLGKALLLKAAIGILSAIVVFAAVAASGFDTATNEALALTTLAQIVNSLSLTFLSAFQAHRKMALVSATSVLNDLLLSGLVILVLPFSPSVRTTLLLTNLVAVLNFMMLWLVYRRTVGKPRVSIDPRVWRQLLKEGFPMAVSAFGISVYMYIGPTVLRYVRPKEEMGLFSAGYKLISILTLIPAAVSQVVYPIFSEFAAQSPQKLQKSLQDALRIMLEISAPLAVGTILLAPRIMHMIYPPEYAAGGIVLQVIIAGNAVGFLAWILTSFLLSIGRQKYCMWTSLSLAVTSTIASLFFVPAHGFTAVPTIIALNEVVLFVSLAAYARRHGYSPGSVAALAKILLASALMGIVVELLNFLPLLVVIVCGVLAYGTLVILFRVVGDQEKEILVRISGFRGPGG